MMQHSPRGVIRQLERLEAELIYKTREYVKVRGQAGASEEHIDLIYEQLVKVVAEHSKYANSLWERK